MPSIYRKSLKSFVVDVVIFVGLAAFAGNVAISLCERYMYRNDLANMRDSLHSLKDIVNIIGITYDNIHRELQDLTMLTEKQLNDILSNPIEEGNNRNKSTLDRRMLHDKNVQALYTSQKLPLINEYRVYQQTKGTVIDKNAATLAKCQMKSTGVDPPCSPKVKNEECRYGRGDKYWQHPHCAGHQWKYLKF